METQVVGGLAFVLVVTGWISLASCYASPRRRIAGVSHLLCVGSMMGLGAVTLAGAFLRMNCALAAGLTLVLLLLGMIIRSANEHSIEAWHYFGPAPTE